MDNRFDGNFNSAAFLNKRMKMLQISRQETDCHAVFREPSDDVKEIVLTELFHAEKFGC